MVGMAGQHTPSRLACPAGTGTPQWPAGQVTLINPLKVCHLLFPFPVLSFFCQVSRVEFLVLRPRLGWLLFRLWLLGFSLGRVLFLDGFRQGVLSSVCHRAVALVRNSVRLPKGDAPLEEQLQLDLHGVRPGFHHDEQALGHTFQLIGGHEGALHHLQGLRPVVFPLADVTRLHSPAAQGFAHRLGSLAVGAKPPKMVSCTLSTMISAPSLP